MKRLIEKLPENRQYHSTLALIDSIRSAAFVHRLVGIAERTGRHIRSQFTTRCCDRRYGRWWIHPANDVGSTIQPSKRSAAAGTPSSWSRLIHAKPPGPNTEVHPTDLPSGLRSSWLCSHRQTTVQTHRFFWNRHEVKPSIMYCLPALYALLFPFTRVSVPMHHYLNLDSSCVV